MEHISCADFRKEMAHYLDRVKYRGERFVIHRRGRDAAVLIPMAELPERALVGPKPADEGAGAPGEMELLRRELGLKA